MPEFKSVHPSGMPRERERRTVSDTQTDGHYTVQSQGVKTILSVCIQYGTKNNASIFAKVHIRQKGVKFSIEDTHW